MNESILTLGHTMSEVEEAGQFRFYTEMSTNLIYEVQLFDKYVIARPATPGFESVIRKMLYKEFIKEFEEYAGSAEDLRVFIHEGIYNGIIVTRK